MDPQPTIDAMSAAAHSLSNDDVRSQLLAVRAAQNALDGATAALLSQLDASKDYEIDGASTLNAWVRTQLRMNPHQASVLVRNAHAMADLPQVAEAAIAGRISAEHVRVFAYGIRHIGLEHMWAFEDVFVHVAHDHAPAELFEAVKHLKDKIHPDDLDDSWLKGMDKQDITVQALPDGWHVSGFLNTITGTKLKKVLDSVSAPTGPDDTRTGPERRVQGLDDLLSDILGAGMPADKGIAPHLSVHANAQTIAAAAQHVKQQTEQPHLVPDPMPDVEPATLEGHGHIGPHLLMYFLCISDITAFMVKTNGGTIQDQILNVGRTQRLATLKQRRAVLTRQQGICATPGCSHTHLEIHHTIWWSRGGPTDLDLLVGLCTRCHHLLHRGGLHITGNAVTGFEFTNRTGRPLRRRRRTSYRQAA